MSCGDLIDLEPDPLQNVGGAIDHRVEQFHQHGFAGCAGGQLRQSLLPTITNGLRIVVAHRDQPVAGQDEGDGRGLRRVGVRLAHHGRGHVPRAVLDIETAGDLDLLHLFAGRHRDAEMALDQLVFRDRGGYEVEPDSVFRKLAAGGNLAALERTRLAGT